MEVKTLKLDNAALAWAVALCERVETGITRTNKVCIDTHQDELPPGLASFDDCRWHIYRPESSWAQGGPIVDEQEITIDYRENETIARKWSDTLNNFIEARAGKKQGLLAAMRCYVAFKLGDSVEIPEELCNGRQ